MKKIILLSLLSVLFLSAFSQITPINSEVLARIEILTSAAEDYDDEIISERGWWIFFYKTVKTVKLPGGGYKLTCTGLG